MPTSRRPASCFAVDENTLVFGVVPDSVDTETNYQPLMDYIAEITGKTVEYHESTDYAALIEAAVAGKVDVASFSGFTYVTATNNGAKLTPISSIVTDEGQEPGYYSQAIVPKDSDISSIADFKGKKVCFVDPSSTSGYLFPSYNLLEAGIDPKTDITPVFAGKHDVSVEKVGEGVECEAGFAEDSEVEKSDAVKVIAETMVPGAPLGLLLDASRRRGPGAHRRPLRDHDRRHHRRRHRQRRHRLVPQRLLRHEAGRRRVLRPDPRHLQGDRSGAVPGPDARRDRRRSSARRRIFEQAAADAGRSRSHVLAPARRAPCHRSPDRRPGEPHERGIRCPDPPRRA